MTSATIAEPKAPDRVSPAVEVGLPNGDERYQLLRRIAWAAFGLQFLALAAWKTFMYLRFSGTLDENEYQQSLYLISRGHLNPVTTAWGRAFIRDHGSFFIWLLAPLDWIPPMGLMLLVVGVAAVVAAEMIAFRWIYEVVEKRRSEFSDELRPLLLGYLGLLVLVASPWTWWVVSFDVHGELFAAPFIIAAARAFSRFDYRRGWLWILCTLGIGAIVSSWIVGLAVSALLAGLLDPVHRRKLWQTGSLILLSGLGSLFGLSALGLDKGSNLNTLYGYLTVPAGAAVPRKLGLSVLVKAMVFHPLRVVHGLLNHLQDLYANLAPTGWVGVLTPWTFGVPVTILMENNLVHGFRFSGPIFQSTPIYTFTAVGLILVLIKVTARWRSRALSVLVVAALALNCTLWAVIFVPHLKSTWVNVSAAQASVLSQVKAEIPQNAEVIVSQGVISRFSMRKYVYGSTNQYHWPAKTRNIWFIVTPPVGIEFTIEHDDTIVDRLADYKYATLVQVDDGIYVFHISLPNNVYTIRLAPKNGEISAALAVGAKGTPSINGSTSNWYTQSTGGRGYVTAHDYWDEYAGDYVAKVRLSNQSPVNVEVWDVDSNTLLARQQLVPDSQARTVILPFSLNRIFPTREAYRGFGPFTVRWKPEGRPGQNQLEVRVWSPGGAPDTVYTIALKRSKHPIT